MQTSFTEQQGREKDKGLNTGCSAHTSSAHRLQEVGVLINQYSAVTAHWDQYGGCADIFNFV